MQKSLCYYLKNIILLFSHVKFKLTGKRLTLVEEPRYVEMDELPQGDQEGIKLLSKNPQPIFATCKLELQYFVVLTRSLSFCWCMCRFLCVSAIRPLARNRCQLLLWSPLMDAQLESGVQTGSQGQSYCL